MSRLSRVARFVMQIASKGQEPFCSEAFYSYLLKSIVAHKMHCPNYCYLNYWVSWRGRADGEGEAIVTCDDVSPNINSSSIFPLNDSTFLIHVMSTSKYGQV